MRDHFQEGHEIIAKCAHPPRATGTRILRRTQEPSHAQPMRPRAANSASRQVVAAATSDPQKNLSSSKKPVLFGKICTSCGSATRRAVSPIADSPRRKLPISSPPRRTRLRELQNMSPSSPSEKYALPARRKLVRFVVTGGSPVTLTVAEPAAATSSAPSIEGVAKNRC
jgi:hypothetical protein